MTPEFHKWFEENHGYVDKRERDQIRRIAWRAWHAGYELAKTEQAEEDAGASI